MFLFCTGLLFSVMIFQISSGVWKGIPGTRRDMVSLIAPVEGISGCNIYFQSQFRILEFRPNIVSCPSELVNRLDNPVRELALPCSGSARDCQARGKSRWYFWNRRSHVYIRGTVGTVAWGSLWRHGDGE
ncbi:hypothetical protein L211DRAFT_347835 [Terfezia boudieri ATCC MYA-4762]|uniref:Secreted protein n=1 Tax=Terfezia boudieri ATCC MYA-4762 TaxID=1051890 RepID=A0A3N4L510_9PEZI|nr:hypothetical protein L211DRAFT_347835 [Terfezia boudieri ATCC MYA-4762]